MKYKYFLVYCLFSVLVMFFTCSNRYEHQSLNGHWEGEISSEGKSLKILFDISAEKFLYDIPDLGLFGEPASKWDITGNDINFEIEGRENINVTGSLENNKIIAEIEGSDDIQLTLNRASNDPVFYSEEEVTYKSDGVVISGTLIKPKSNQPYPVIVFVHGSGKMIRETMRSRAYMFVQNGSAVLIFDRRGKGKSEGDTSRILPISVMTGDVIAGVEFLKERKDIDKKKIGLYGLSQGGWVVPNAVSLCKDVTFIIAVSAPGITPDEQNDYVVDNIVKNEVKKFTKINKWIEEFDTTINSYMEQESSFREKSNKNGTEIVPGFSGFNPIPAWESITIPVLAVWGELDEIVPHNKSRIKIENALKKSGNNSYTLKTFDGANHVIKLAGEKEKFAGKWEVTAPGSNEFIAGWFKKTILGN
ncbi:MAG: alpha/beta fold hydrolase [Ignavibacteria bacterium]